MTHLASREPWPEPWQTWTRCGRVRATRKIVERDPTCHTCQSAQEEDDQRLAAAVSQLQSRGLFPCAGGPE